MLCPHCQNEHPDEVDFCPMTGRKIVLPAPAEPQPALQLFCMHCGQPVQVDWRICGFCGQPLQGPPSILNQADRPSKPAFRLPTMKMPSGKGSSRWLGCSLGAIGGIVIFLGALLLLDSFTLHLVGRLNGNYDSAAAALPSQSRFYIGINFLNAQPAQLERLTAPFSAVGSPQIAFESHNPHQALSLTAPSGQNGPGGLMDELFSIIETEFGLRVPDDLTPWVGQFGGVALLSKNDDSPYNFADNLPVLALETRNPPAADRFMEDWAVRLEDRTQVSYTTTTYRGMKIYQPVQGSGLVFTRSGWMVLAAADKDALLTVVEARQQGDTLMKQKDFKDLLAAAPAGRLATFYLAGQSIDSQRFGPTELLGMFGLMLGGLVEPEQGLLATASIVDAGLQFDMYSSTAGATAARKELLDAYRSFSPRTARYFPEDTTFFVTAPRFDLSVNTAFSGLTGSSGLSSQTFFDEFENEFGVDPEKDLLPYLSQDWAFGVVVGGDYGIDLYNGIRMEWLMSTDTKNRQGGQAVADQIAQTLETQSSSFRQRERNDVSYYEFPLEGEPLTYTFDGRTLLFSYGRDMTAMEDYLNQGTSLADTDAYRNTWKAFPRGMKPFMYLNLEKLFDLLGPQLEMFGDDLQMEVFGGGLDTLRPVQRLAVATGPLSRQRQHTTLIIFLSGQ
jgi:hypothetical protein